jgi:hypothetical protein
LLKCSAFLNSHEAQEAASKDEELKAALEQHRWVLLSMHCRSICMHICLRIFSLQGQEPWSTGSAAPAAAHSSSTRQQP